MKDFEGNIPGFFFHVVDFSGTQSELYICNIFSCILFQDYLNSQKSGFFL